MNKCTIQILSGGRRQEPAVIEGVKWETSRAGEPSVFTFTCIKDEALAFSEGAKVIFSYGDTNVFHGFVFKKSRNKEHHIEVTCYDKLRYFKNKNNYVFTNVRLDQIVTRLAEDVEIPLGEITNTRYVIPKFAAEELTLFDIINQCSAYTEIATKEIYCVYEDYDKLCLKSKEEMMLPIVIDHDTAEDFNYATSIDDETYNQIVVKQSDSEGNSSGVTVVNSTTQGQWGVLQKIVDVPEGVSPSEMARLALERYNQVSRSLNIVGQFGDIRVRGGSGLYVNLNLGDMIVKRKMWVEKVTHTFDNSDHYMDLTLIDWRDFRVS